MIHYLGNLSLTAATILAVVSLITAILSARKNSPRLLQTAWISIILHTLALTITSICLMSAMVQSDFQFSYVESFSERSLPIGFKIAAFWAGQEGSLLLWGWFVAVLGSIALIQWRKRSGVEHAATIATLAVVCGFFASLLLFAANPFTINIAIPEDGHGLNPMLQDPAMIAHPPLLFMGYAGFTIPFALLIGAMVAGRKDDQWSADCRRWVLVAWLFLSAGIILGAEWAYVELGWGGYWAWDPVENASLLPWFTATALLHSIMVQQRRSMFKFWNALLVATTFILCIFGSYLTRSGIVQSVHTFEGSLVATFFLVFLLITIALSIGILCFWRYSLLQSKQELDGLVSREGAFLALNALMVLMMLTTLVGTIFPVIGKLFSADPITVSQPFYNKVVLPMAGLSLAIMAMGPLLFFGADAAAKFSKKIIIPAPGSLIALVIAWVLGVRDIWALVCVGVTTLAVLSIAVDFATALFSRMKATDENPLLAAINMSKNTHRRYGAQITHMGMILIMSGVAGSSLYNTNHTFELKADQTVSFDQYQMTYEGLDKKEQPNHTAIQAVLALTDPAGITHVVRPQMRFFPKTKDPNREVAIMSGWKRDVYFVLAGWDDGGKIATVQIIINPLVSWIWAGSIIMLLGGMICLVPATAAVRENISENEKTQTSRDRQEAVGLAKDTGSLTVAARQKKNSETEPTFT